MDKKKNDSEISYIKSGVNREFFPIKVLIFARLEKRPVLRIAALSTG